MDAQKVKKLAIARSCLYGAKLDAEQIAKPLIAIVYAQNEICPGHMHLDSLADAVRRGIESEGGTGIKINAGVGVCDGIAMGHDGMKYSLPSRELNRDAVVNMIKAHGVFVGVVYIGACDKNLPGYLMAAMSLQNMPAVFVTSGPMLPGYVNGKYINAVASYESLWATGKISMEEYEDVLTNCNPTIGTCAGLFTANSMACITEALGLTLPGMATSSAIGNNKYRQATASGRSIIHLVKSKNSTKNIIGKESFQNALTVIVAMGGSTNTMLHLPAIAKEAEIELSLDEISSICAKTPSIIKLAPASYFNMVDLELAGGLPLIMKRLMPLLKLDAKTIDGTLRERVEKTKDSGDITLVKTVKDPYSSTAGLAIYKGNLAPEGAVMKESAVDSEVPTTFTGTAKVFNSEEEAVKYINSPLLHKKDVIVICYEGPAGGPGMREMLYATSALVGTNMQKDVALITDGRFSGASSGICIGHIQPEAYNGGLIGLVKDGDQIKIDRIKKEVNLLLDNDQIAARKKVFKPVIKPAEDNILKNYRDLYSLKNEKG